MPQNVRVFVDNRAYLKTVSEVSNPVLEAITNAVDAGSKNLKITVTKKSRSGKATIVFEDDGNGMSYDFVCNYLNQVGVKIKKDVSKIGQYDMGRLSYWKYCAAEKNGIVGYNGHIVIETEANGERTRILWNEIDRYSAEKIEPTGKNGTKIIITVDDADKCSCETTKDKIVSTIHSKVVSIPMSITVNDEKIEQNCERKIKGEIKTLDKDGKNVVLKYEILIIHKPNGAALFCQDGIVVTTVDIGELPVTVAMNFKRMDGVVIHKPDRETLDVDESSLKREMLNVILGRYAELGIPAKKLARVFYYNNSDLDIYLELLLNWADNIKIGEKPLRQFINENKGNEKVVCFIPSFCKHSISSSAAKSAKKVGYTVINPRTVLEKNPGFDKYTTKRLLLTVLQYLGIQPIDSEEVLEKISKASFTVKAAGKDIKSSFDTIHYIFQVISTAYYHVNLRCYGYYRNDQNDIEPYCRKVSIYEPVIKVKTPGREFVVAFVKPAYNKKNDFYLLFRNGIGLNLNNPYIKKAAKTNNWTPLIPMFVEAFLAGLGNENMFGDDETEKNTVLEEVLRKPEIAAALSFQVS